MPDTATTTAPLTAREIMLRDVMAGLSMPQKELSPKYLYDAHGSELFEAITRLDEYYPTRREQALLEAVMPGWVGELAPRTLVELGAGSARKSRVILDAMARVSGDSLYVPVDISGDFLREAAARLRDEYGDLRVEPAVADMTQPFDLPVTPRSPTWYALLGSTIGNFEEPRARRLLSRVASRLGTDDLLLLGVDRSPGPHKSKARIELAYNDAAEVTAAFNLNVLRVLNRELDADFDLDAFEHSAHYDEAHDRMEIRLVARSPQQVAIPGGGVVTLETGETIRTELSHKYDRLRVEALFAAADLEVARWAEDDDGYFALVLGRPSTGTGRSARSGPRSIAGDTP